MKQKVYFYSTNISSFQSIQSEKDLIHQTRGLESWIHITAYYLQKHSELIEPVVVDHVPDEGVIVFHKGFFPKTIRPALSQYFICVQADYGRHRFAQMHLVQNAKQIANVRSSKQSVADNFFSFTAARFIPGWVQPGLRERNPDRGITIENVGFFGNPEQFPEENIKMLSDGLSTRNMTLQLKLDPISWSDYHDTDIALSIRSFDRKPYYHKPISKLVNAVLCNSLIIAGAESSSNYFRKKYYPELPIVVSVNELLAAVDKLKADPVKAYTELQEARSRLSNINTIGLVQEWEKLLAHALRNFGRWQSLNLVSRKLFISTRAL